MLLRRRLLSYLPPVAMLLAAAAIPANMRTGHPHYEFWQTLRGGLIATAFLYLPAAYFVRALLDGLRQQRAGNVATRIAGGRCGRCGYDLRATPGRCSECGAVPPACDA